MKHMSKILTFVFKNASNLVLRSVLDLFFKTLL